MRTPTPFRPALRTGLLASALVLFGGLAVGSGSGCKPAAESGAVPEKKAAAAAPVQAKFGSVVEQEVPQRLDVTGTLDPDERSEVAAQTSGRVSDVLVDLGSRVKQGDLLVELDGREASMRNDVASATAASQRARLGLKGADRFQADSVPDVVAAKEAADLATAEFERAKALFEAGALPKAQYDQARSAKDRSDAGYAIAKNGAEQGFASLLASQSQAGLSSKSLSDTKVRAPFDGSVVERRVTVGEFANMGKVVAVVVRDNPLRLRFDVPEAQAGAIKIGNPVELSVAAFPGRVFAGEVKRLGAMVKVQSRSLPVEAEVPNEELTLRPGFFAQASVSLAGDNQKVLLVPKTAIATLGSSKSVFVKKGDRVEERLILVGRTRGELVEISGNIANGEEVAIDKISELSDGAQLAP